MYDGHDILCYLPRSTSKNPPSAERLSYTLKFFLFLFFSTYEYVSCSCMSKNRILKEIAHHQSLPPPLPTPPLTLLSACISIHLYAPCRAVAVAFAFTEEHPEFNTKPDRTGPDRVGPDSYASAWAFPCLFPGEVGEGEGKG